MGKLYFNWSSRNDPLQKVRKIERKNWSFAFWEEIKTSERFKNRRFASTIRSNDNDPRRVDDLLDASFFELVVYGGKFVKFGEQKVWREYCMLIHR